MADASTAQLRIMLQRYEQQLLAARQLARFRVRRRMAEGLTTEPDMAQRRRVFVEKVARELYEALIHTGSDNPVVEEIRAELGREVGQEVRFAYPPGERLKILDKGEKGLRPLNAEQQRSSQHALWRITRRKVEESMLDDPKTTGLALPGEV